MNKMIERTMERVFFLNTNLDAQIQKYKAELMRYAKMNPTVPRAVSVPTPVPEPEPYTEMSEAPLAPDSRERAQNDGTAPAAVINNAYTNEWL